MIVAKGLQSARASRARLVVLAYGLAAAAALLAFWLWNEREAPASPVAYVLCGDDLLNEIRAYRVDLLAGEMTSVSEPIDWLGDPHQIAYDPVHSRLYIASMNKKWSPPMWPVTALRARGGEFEVAARFPANRDNNLLEKARAGKAPDGRSREVYGIVVSPDGNELYVSYGWLYEETGANMQVWDADTGEILRGLPNFIESHYEWSPDGDYVAQIWPSHDRRVYEDGEAVTKARKGGVRVINMRTDERFGTDYLEDNESLHPPWGRIEEPLVHLFDRAYMEDEEVGVYDRDTGEALSKLGIRQLTGLTLAGNPAIAVLEGGRLIAVAAVKRTEAPESYPPRSLGFRREGYVVLIDVMERREVSRTRVGARCTNAVVAYE